MKDFPNWLPNQAIFPDTEVLSLIRESFRLAFLEQENNENLNFCQSLTRLLIELKADASLISAGILACGKKEIEKEIILEKCGKVVLEILNSLENLALIDELHDKDNDIEKLRKMLLAMAGDLRAVILKLALQVVIMQEIHKYPPETQQKIALKTRDLFAPLANRLGIAQLKWQLEDSALRILEPDIYNELNEALEEKRVDRERYIKRVIAELEFTLTKENIAYNKIYGRVKHINSIYLKMKRKKLRFEQVNDVRAVRIECMTEEECYQILSVLNNLWQPVGEEFDDYIAHPKANGYQSLHCTFITPEKKTLEVQIRTKSMHEKAELGVAAHWKYKEKGIHHSKKFELQIQWLRQVLEGEGDSHRGDTLFDQFRNEAFKDRVYAISPEGKVIDLPEGATPLDFAYHIHSNLGHRCKGAKVNGVIVPLTRALKNGDRVEILAGKELNPSPDWLSEHLGYLQSGRARAKLRSYFKKQAKEKSIELGREMLFKELKRLSISANLEEISQIAKKFNVNNETDLFASVGAGDLSALAVAHELSAKIAKKVEKLEPKKLTERVSKIPIKAQKIDNSKNVEIEGFGTDTIINFASCCKPMPPAPLAGFLTKGRGINIHRKNCINLAHLAKIHPERIVVAKWKDKTIGLFHIDVEIYAYDRPHILRDISQTISNEKIPIVKIDIRHNKKSHLQGKISLEIKDISQLSRIMDRIAQIKGVMELHRVGS